MKIEPSARSYTLLEAAHPPLAAARAAEVAARKALEELRETEQFQKARRDAEIRRLSAAVRAGRDSITVVNAPLRDRDIAPELVAPVEKAIAEARARVDEELKRAIAVFGGSIRDRRDRLRAQVATARVKDLERLKRGELELVNEAHQLVNNIGHHLLRGPDLGEPLSWPCCWADEVSLRTAGMKPVSGLTFAA